MESNKGIFRGSISSLDRDSLWCGGLACDLLQDELETSTGRGGGLRFVDLGSSFGWFELPVPREAQRFESGAQWQFLAWGEKPSLKLTADQPVKIGSAKR